jgi:hypothetical protein
VTDWEWTPAERLGGDVRVLLGLNTRLRKKHVKDLKEAETLINQAIEKSGGLPQLGVMASHLSGCLHEAIRHVEESIKAEKRS